MLGEVALSLCLVVVFAVPSVFADAKKPDALSEYLAAPPSPTDETEQVMALLHQLREEYTAALIARVEAEAARNPKNARAHLLLSALYSEQLDEKKATQELQMAASLDPYFAKLSSSNALRRTMSDMRNAGTAFESYAVDNNLYPAGETPELEKILTPIYIRILPAEDAWGHPFVYKTSKDGHHYWIISYGKDGSPDQGIYRDGLPIEGLSPAKDLNDDLIFSDGTFLRQPEDSK